MISQEADNVGNADNMWYDAHFKRLSSEKCVASKAHCVPHWESACAIN